MIHAVDNAQRALWKARERTFTAFASVTGAQYLKIAEALKHIDRAKLALRGIA